MSSTLLVLDVGNTNVVLGIYRDDKLVSSWRLATARDRTADEYGILARQLLNGAVHQPLDGAIIGSVVPPLNGPRGRVARSAPLNAIARISVPTAHANR